jgi:twinkle protein
MQRKADEWIDAHFRISVMPEDEPVTLEMVEAEMTSAALHHDCQVFVLDPWNEVEHRFNRGENETQYIERALRQLLRSMRRLNLVLVIAAHPTKLSEGEKASLYKISGSANWKNKAQHGLVIRKQSDHTSDVELVVEKSKDWETMGKPGSVWLEFNREKCDYFSTQ